MRKVYYTIPTDWKNILQPADIILNQGDTFDSRLIRFVNNSAYSHSCIYLGNGSMIEATFPSKSKDRRAGVMISPVTKYENRDKAILRCKSLTLWQKQTISTWTLNHVGEKFSHKKALATVLPITLEEKEEGWFCSEIICAAYKNAGMELLSNSTRCLVSPSDFLNSSSLTKVFVKRGSIFQYFQV